MGESFQIQNFFILEIFRRINIFCLLIYLRSIVTVRGM